MRIGMAAALAGLWLTGLSLTGAAGQAWAAEGGCAAGAQVAGQMQDAETIKRIEQAWLTAEYHGQVEVLDCLLAPGYQVIDAKRGTSRTKADLLARVAQNRGKTPEVPPLATTVVINGDHATAYSKMSGKKANGEAFEASYVDVYLFRDGAWNAISGVDM